ncbi:hypothetical protein JD844_023187 [Phrynosoma platyrhinos]|uniref:Uncharacterized protein n=1 Tax=Phrynosoma platyrhinos TaxID=52577 RepID=A0ABQ7SW45_PHRPL|nr:hypothetical protein JD844_023187 [Phrynosoma platyrhinos]
MHLCVDKAHVFEHVNRFARWAKFLNIFHFGPQVLMYDFLLWILNYKGDEAFLKSKQKNYVLKLRTVFCSFC